MIQQPQPLDLDAIEARYSDHLAQHSHMVAFACCSAHASADDVPALVAEVRRLTAERDTRTPADEQRRTCPTHGYLTPQFDPSICTCPPGA